MKKLFLVSVFLLVTTIVSAETIKLKSGQVIEGNVIEKTDDYIKINFQGVKLTFYREELASVGGEISALDNNGMAQNNRPRENLKDPNELAQNPEEIGVPYKTIKITYVDTSKYFNDKNELIPGLTSEEILFIDAINNKSREERNAGQADNWNSFTKIYDGSKMCHLGLKPNVAVCFTSFPEGYHVWRQVILDDKSIIGEEDFLGRKCRIYQQEDMKMWIWNGLILKSELKSQQIFLVKEAVKIEENTTLDPDLFMIPQGMSIEEDRAFFDTLSKDMREISGKEPNLEDAMRLLDKYNPKLKKEMGLLNNNNIPFLACELMDPSKDGRYNINGTITKFIPPEGWKQNNKAEANTIDFRPSCLEFVSLVVSISPALKHEEAFFLRGMKSIADKDSSYVEAKVDKFLGREAFISTKKLPDGIKVKVIEFIEKNKVIEIRFRAKEDDFDKTLPIIQGSFNTFEVLQE